MTLYNVFWACGIVFDFEQTVLGIGINGFWYLIFIFFFDQLEFVNWRFRFLVLADCVGSWGLVFVNYSMYHSMCFGLVIMVFGFGRVDLGIDRDVFWYIFFLFWSDQFGFTNCRIGFLDLILYVGVW